MARLLILDTDDEGIVIPLKQLWEVILHVVPDVMADSWEVLSSYGYGEHVCNYEDALNAHGQIEVSSEELANVLNSSEIFYDARFSARRHKVTFGVSDS